MNLETRSLQRVAAVLLSRAGLRIGPDGYPGLKVALKARMEQLGVAEGGAYARLVETDAAELQRLLPLVTIGKTEFFRDEYQFRALARNVLPDALARAEKEERPVKFWSAGCATGEEPYSLAMLAVEWGASPDAVEILGTDVNAAAIETAQRAQYEEKRLMGLSAQRVQRFFASEGKRWVVTPELRRFVRFAHHNLAAPMWAGAHAQSLDVIFCRNVLIYFDEKTKLAVMERFYETLRPGGWLFLGYSESLFKSFTRFQMVEVEGAFLYRRPLPQAPRRPEKHPSLQEPAPPAPVAVRETPETCALGEVHLLLERGEFASAEQELLKLLDREPAHLEARLTWGNIQALKGDLEAARAAYQFVAEREPLSIEPHLFTALAHLQTGASQDAHKALTAALFLDPMLAVGYLVLGQVHEREADIEAAAKAYRQVLSFRGVEQRLIRGFFPELPRCSELLARVAEQRLKALSAR